MSDDSFFREVDEELRQDRVKAVWTRFGAWLLGGAVAVIAVTAGVVAYEHYQTNQANAAGDRYAAAMRLADEGKSEDAIEALQDIAGNGVGAYPALARLSIGGIEAKAGRPEEAVAAYDAVANDSDVPGGLRDMAAIRAAYVLVDSGSLDDVRQRVERLSGDSDPLRFPAREAIALAAWKAGDAETAKPLLQGLVTDSGTPSDISGRARILLDLINSGATGPNALPPAEGGATPPPASADNGLGAVDLPGLLDGGSGQETTAGDGEAGTSGVAMPTTGLGQAGGEEAPAPAEPAEAAPSQEAAPAAPQSGDSSAPATAAPNADGSGGSAPSEGTANGTAPAAPSSSTGPAETTAPASPASDDQAAPAATTSPAPTVDAPADSGAGAETAPADGGSSAPADDAAGQTPTGAPPASQPDAATGN
ncbi:tetratricopeptide repeat protein [Jiella avicenniae]|uniref:Ancillary SecYEG translocon subunit n=1 Tax=Jiella avicenniae TaxID=2907202 RepID=A0A9X1P3R4_9HYPH|nr:tetratricopeptide repeat protein [Jiella avicenniae]MCE7030900.1 tetratricopeptide repeat protein [Jiella avicenniae]